MQQADSNLETYRGLAPLGGKLTTDSEDAIRASVWKTSNPLTTQRQRPPVEDDELPPAVSTSSAVSEPNISRRASRLNIRSMFGKNKPMKSGRFETQLQTASEVFPSDLSAQQPAQAQAADPLPKETAKAKTPATAKARTSKNERAPLMTWDPPPLFQAYPQAVKSGVLLAPVLPVESVLRMDRERRLQEEQGTDQEKRNDRNASGAAHIQCRSKVYVLATSGFLLQYSSEGSHDRLPEKIMQLGKESATYATDAIPSKHWCLQVTQVSIEDGSDLRKANAFWKMGLGGGSKRSVANFLLVMSSAEEMDSWLVSIRDLLGALGALKYRKSGALSPSNEAFDRRPTYHASIIHAHPSLSPEKIIFDSPASLCAPSEKSCKSLQSPTPGVQYAYHNPVTRRGSIDGSVTSARHNGPNTGKALPPPPNHQASVPVNVLGIIPLPGTMSPTTEQFHGKSNTPRSATFASTSPNLPISTFNSELNAHRSSDDHAATDVESRTSTERSHATNFSVPSFSRRNPQSKETNDCRAASAASTYRSQVRTPSLDSGPSLRTDSMSETMQRDVDVAVVVPLSPFGQVHIGNQFPELVTIQTPGEPKIPNRLSSLDYNGPTQPWSPNRDLTAMAQLRSASASPRFHRPSQSSINPQPGAAFLEAPSGTPRASMLPPLPHSRNTSTGSQASKSSKQSDVLPMRRSGNMHLQTSSASSLRTSASTSNLRAPAPPPLTIKQRRAMLSKAAVHGPPSMPPPTNALPPLPGPPPTNSLPPLPPPPPPPTAISAQPKSGPRPLPSRNLSHPVCTKSTTLAPLPPSRLPPPPPKVTITPTLQTSDSSVPALGSGVPTLPLTPPTQHTPPSLSARTFQQSPRLPESPPTREYEFPPRTSGLAPLLAPLSPLSPMSPTVILKSLNAGTTAEESAKALEMPKQKNEARKQTLEVHEPSKETPEPVREPMQGVREETWQQYLQRVGTA